MQFSFEKYEKQQADRKAASTQTRGDLPKTHFINEYLKEDGAVVVVRFPYTKKSDMIFETTHRVKFPGSKWEKRVSCSGDDCPLCKEGVKLETRFFVKAVVYGINDATGEVELIPAVWDRPAAFADIDMKNLMEEYGDLSEQLFKIKRNGSGLDTRYTMSVIMNKTVYNPEVYKKDFSCLDNVDPVRIMTKTVEQYQKAIAEENGEVVTEPVESKPIESKPVVEPVKPVEEVRVAPAPAAELRVNVTNTGRSRYSF